MRRFPRISDTPDEFDSLGRKICRNCDAQIGEKRKHYCSERCMNEFFRNNTWKFVRRDVLMRDKRMCGVCGGKFRMPELEVDHIIPIKLGGKKFDKLNLRTLCKKCHKVKSRMDSKIGKEDWSG